tara:strand:- start:58 stop:258 length:201 start_codon:yes stop_codon:yes gene_type:complete
MPMNIFTHLNKRKKKKIINVLDQEIKIIESAILLNSSNKLNERLLNYSKSLYVIDDKDENETLILN